MYYRAARHVGFVVSGAGDRQAKPLRLWGVFILTLIKLASWLFAPSKESEQAQVAAGRETVEKAAKNPAVTAALIVYRKRAFVGALSPAQVYCDGSLIAVLKNGSYAACRVAAGQHSLCVGSPSNKAQTILTPVAGEESFLRCNFLKGKLESVSKEAATMEMRALERVE